MNKYCAKCGTELDENIKFCPNCGQEIGKVVSPTQNQNANVNNQPKSKIAAGILGILLGSLGVHNFYLGYTSKGIAQLLLTLVGWIACGIGPIAAGIWGLVEGIQILTGSIDKDANGIKLQD